MNTQIIGPGGRQATESIARDEWASTWFRDRRTPRGRSPLEWRARREALGLPQDVYARLVGVSQDVVSKWEHGRRSPRDPVGVHMRMSELEDILEDLIAQIVADAVVGDDVVELVTYATDEDWWAASPGARRAGLPAQLHRVATARAAVELVRCLVRAGGGKVEEFGCRVEIVAG